MGSVGSIDKLHEAEEKRGDYFLIALLANTRSNKLMLNTVCTGQSFCDITVVDGLFVTETKNAALRSITQAEIHHLLSENLYHPNKPIEISTPVLRELLKRQTFSLHKKEKKKTTFYMSFHANTGTLGT